VFGLGGALSVSGLFRGVLNRVSRVFEGS
jgi:hypothetical protein